MHAWLGWVPLRALILLHVLSAFAFLLAHGPSIAVMLRLRKERDPRVVSALLDTSRQWSQASWGAWAFLALTGALLASVEHAWGKPWVWGSVVVLVLVTGLMSPLAANVMNHARAAAGLRYFDGRRMHPGGEPLDQAALDAALEKVRARTWPVMILGVVGTVVLVWLMTWKPFG